MSHGGQIDPERSRAQIIQRASLGSCARIQYRLLQTGDGKLPCRLAERNQSHGSGDQITHIALQKGGQCQLERHTLSPRTSTQHNSQRCRHFVLTELIREPVKERIRPRPSQHRERGRRLLCRFERELRRAPEGGGYRGKLQQLRALTKGNGAPRETEEDRLIAYRAVAKIRLQPLEQTAEVVHVSRFDSPLQTVRVAV